MNRLYADIVFPELERELKRNPGIIGNAEGLFEVKILDQGQPRGTWYILLRGRQGPPPSITTHRPTIPQKLPLATDNNAGEKFFKVVKVEIEDRDMLKLITGGMNGIKAYTQKKLKISGDLELARKLEQVFVKAGGVKRVMAFIRKNYPKSKL